VRPIFAVGGDGQRPAYGYRPRRARPQRSSGPRTRRRAHGGSAGRSATSVPHRPRLAIDPLADPGIAASSTRFADQCAMAELMLEVAPAYLSDTEASDVLAPLCAAIGESLKYGLAARRYALSGDRRALHGVL